MRQLETVADVVAAYLQETEQVNASRSIKCKRSVLARFAMAHAQMRVTDVTKALFVGWVDAPNRCRTEKTRRSALFTVERPFRWAKNAGLLPDLNIFESQRRKRINGQQRKPVEGQRRKRIEQRQQPEAPMSALRGLTELLEAYPASSEAVELETVGEVVAAYLRATERVNASRAVKSKRSVLARFAKAHGELRVADLTEAVFAAWVDAPGRCRTAKTRQWSLYAVLRPFRWAKAAGLLPELETSLFDGQRRAAVDRRHLKRTEQRQQAEVPVSALKALNELLDAHPELRNLIASRSREASARRDTDSSRALPCRLPAIAGPGHHVGDHGAGGPTLERDPWHL
jgi:hypothetical protein